MSSVPVPIADFLTAFAVATAIYVLFERLQANAGGLIYLIGCFLLRYPQPSDSSIDQSTWGQFSSLLDLFFGQKHWTWRCFSRSAVISYVFVVVLIFILYKLRLSSFERDNAFLMMFVLAAFINVLVDYLSLLESRVVIRWMTTSRSVLLITTLVLVDIALTILMFFSMSLFVVLIMDIIDPEPSLIFTGSTPSENVMHVLHLCSDVATARADQEFSVLYYSTFSTSVWVWLYAGSAMLIRTLALLDSGRRWLIQMNIEEQPIRAIGLVASFGMFILTWIALIMV